VEVIPPSVLNIYFEFPERTVVPATATGRSSLRLQWSGAGADDQFGAELGDRRERAGGDAGDQGGDQGADRLAALTQRLADRGQRRIGGRRGGDVVEPGDGQLRRDGQAERPGGVQRAEGQLIAEREPLFFWFLAKSYTFFLFSTTFWVTMALLSRGGRGLDRTGIRRSRRTFLRPRSWARGRSCT